MLRYLRVFLMELGSECFQGPLYFSGDKYIYFCFLINQDDENIKNKFVEKLYNYFGLQQ